MAALNVKMELWLNFNERDKATIDKALENLWENEDFHEAFDKFLVDEINKVEPSEQASFDFTASFDPPWDKDGELITISQKEKVEMIKAMP